MTDQELSDLLTYRWMPSRIPARDALSTFVPDAPAPEPIITEMGSRAGGSRWYPVQGGHRVLMLYDGGPFDAARFNIEPGLWDHEHCDICQDQIRPMILCHVTEPEFPYVLLCASCFKKHVTSKQLHRPWWKFWPEFGS